jgi:hypothetical protein
VNLDTAEVNTTQQYDQGDINLHTARDKNTHAVKDNLSQDSSTEKELSDQIELKNPFPIDYVNQFINKTDLLEDLQDLDIDPFTNTYPFGVDAVEHNEVHNSDSEEKPSDKNGMVLRNNKKRSTLNSKFEN